MFSILRKYIREQIAHAGRNAYTIDTMPHTFEDIDGYDIDIVANVNGNYSLTVKFGDEKISPASSYKDYDEAHHQARMIIDKHRVQVMDAT